MVQAVKKEKKSCLWKEHKAWIEAKDMCNACFELYMYGSSNVNTYELKTTGVCLSLHPESNENLSPSVLDGDAQLPNRHVGAYSKAWNDINACYRATLF